MERVGMEQNGVGLETGRESLSSVTVTAGAVVFSGSSGDESTKVLDERGFLRRRDATKIRKYVRLPFVVGGSAS